MVSTGSRNMIIVQQPAVIVGTRTFTNLLEATGDTSQTKNAGVYKVYFARGKGIVAFSEYPSLQTWVKQ
ncbi:MAG: hypothetical protein EOO14_21975 [Chitinophagaceae bacterium]|nr:MAG: hypothetical protein EOO14_21975 [Chitinophagaceae bacterium]